MNTDTSTSPGFAAGFVTAIAVLLALAVGVHAAEWLVSHPQPQAFIQFVTQPLFSILDVLNALIFLVILYVVGWMVAFGPRL